MISRLDYKWLFQNYSKFQNFEFMDRYISFENLENYLAKEIFPVFSNEIIGFSELQKPIYSIDVGNGPKKILIWSQMHGNESTTTKALLDFLNVVQSNILNPSMGHILKSCHIKIIPMLNPDGSSAYTRHNSNGFDLNRNAIQRSQKETQCFFKCLEDFKPHYCFNLHGQRTIFSAGDFNKSATMSFLAPSYNHELSVNTSREKAMKLIVSANELLSEYIPNQIGKYDDAHNPNCFGDHIQKMGIPTVLFEAGHFSGDYNRNITRKYAMLSLVEMIETIAINEIDKFKLVDYFEIPNNKKLFLDVIIKNVSNSKSSYIGIQFNEILQGDRIIFKPYVNSMDDLSGYFAHLVIDANHNSVSINEEFTFETELTIEQLKIGSDYFDFKLYIK